MKTLACCCDTPSEAARVKDLLIAKGYSHCRVTSKDFLVAGVECASELQFFNGFTSHGDEHDYYAQDAQVHGIAEPATTLLIDVENSDVENVSLLLLRFGVTNVSKSENT